MTPDKKTYWIEIAEEDFDTAKFLFSGGRWLYADYECHQAIEKMLKAAIARDGVFPPKIHNLRRLAEIGELWDKMSEEQKTFIDTLQPACIEARYPEYKEKINKLLGNATSCRQFIANTGELLPWIKARL
ncbi:DNA-binding protein [Planctomycetales bacterium]|nr:DNA-binding protein [Planctomycetales bacterium]GHT06317.1 DNA-binding protein [Planctomycetales bacterium]